MKIIAWNCRGLGNGSTIRGLLNIQKEEDPDILFLSETKLDRARIGGLRWRIGLTNMVVKDCRGRSGGLALFWRNGINFQLRAMSRLYIDGEVEEKDGFVWRLTGFYGEPSSDKKFLSWRALWVLNAARRRSWLCLGNFNEILMCYENKGGNPRPHGCMENFRQALEECSLDDLGFTGDIFTWRNNSHTSDQYVRESLDRAVTDIEWHTRFPDFLVRNGEPRHSDHRPMIVTMEKKEPVCARRNGPNFRFEASWLKEENCEVVVENAWRLSIDERMQNVAGAVKNVAANLLYWSKNTLGDLEKCIKHTKKALEACQRGSITKESVAGEEILKYK
jgi:hypothetical protein